jgi:hypothetical protein
MPRSARVLCVVYFSQIPVWIVFALITAAAQEGKTPVTGIADPDPASFDEMMLKFLQDTQVHPLVHQAADKVKRWPNKNLFAKGL